MNQDAVKEKLLAIEDAPLEFSLVFSGKKSKKRPRTARSQRRAVRPFSVQA